MKYNLVMGLVAFVLPAFFVLSACSHTANPDVLDKGDACVRFSVNVGNIVPAKGTMLGPSSELAKINVTAWNCEESDRNRFINGYREFTLESGAVSTDIRWTKPYFKVFYAYANLPSSYASVTSSSYEGQKLEYTVPDYAKDQNDILMGVYSGDGDSERVAEITFKHALTSVVFKVGTLTGVKAIKSVTINGVFASGNVTQTSVGTFGTWSGTTTVKSVSQTVTGSLPEIGSQIGVPFILIPQTNSAGLSVELELTLSDNSTLNCTGTLGDTASGVIWEAGKTNTYSISFANDKGLNFSTPVVSEWGEGGSLAEEMTDPEGPRPNEIWYTTSNEKIIQKSNVSTFVADKTYFDLFGANLVSNKYSNGLGIMKFDAPILFVADYALSWEASYYETEDNINKLTSIIFPEGVKTFGEHIINKGESGSRIPDGFSRITFPNSTESINRDVIRYPTDDFDFSIFYNGVEYTEKDVRYPHSIYFTLVSNGTVAEIHFNCFTQGTLITLADGSKKKVEEITYDDELLVWNFDKGCYDTTKVLWLTRSGLKTPYYFKCTFSDGTVLNVVGEDGGGTHRLFDKTKGSFEHPHTIPVDDEIYTEHGLVRLVSYERIDEEVEFYNLITEQHINCFANEVLTSARYNNRYPIDQDMKFVKDGRKVRPYREFRKAGINRQWYDGMRLGEQQDSIPRVKAYIDRCELNGDLNPDWKEPGFFARIWNWIKGLFS